MKKEARAFLRYFYSGVTECLIDKLGRILIPQSLKADAAIKKSVVIIGMGNKIEIWAQERWEELVKKATSDPEHGGRYCIGTRSLMDVIHTPVLVGEVIGNLVTSQTRLFVDATLGGAGHAVVLLERFKAVNLIGLDIDDAALKVAEERLRPYKEG
jgi:hypothetical protein